jgi:hypothetical protein
VIITAVPIIKLFAWGEGDSAGHVLRETTSRGLCGLVCGNAFPIVLQMQLGNRAGKLDVPQKPFGWPWAYGSRRM